MDEFFKISVLDFKKYLKKQTDKTDNRCYYSDEDKRMSLLDKKIKLKLSVDKITVEHLILFFNKHIIYYRKDHNKKWYSHFLFPGIEDFESLYNVINPNHKIRDLSFNELKFIEYKTGFTLNYEKSCDKALLCAILDKTILDLTLCQSPRGPIPRAMNKNKKETKKEIARNENERACFEARKFLESKLLEYYLAFTDISPKCFIEKGNHLISSCS